MDFPLGRQENTMSFFVSLSQPLISFFPFLREMIGVDESRVLRIGVIVPSFSL